MTTLLRSTAVVGSMTLVSRILGFVRDMLYARLFGAGVGMDAFFVAFRIPNLLRRLFAEGAFSQAFVPVLSEYKTRDDAAQMRRFVDDVAGTLGGILILVTVLGVIGAPLIVMAFAPGFLQHAEKFALTVSMLRITFPYLLFISLTALAGGILNSFSRFAIPALTPVFLNLCMIGAALWVAPHTPQPIVYLAWGVFVAGIVQLVFQFPFLRQLRLLPRPRWAWHDPGVQRILRLMLPAIFGSSVAQINLLVNTLLASFLVTGSVTWLYYTDRLVEFPLGIFGVALATVILPGLSRKHAAAEPEEFSRMLDWGVRWVLLIGTPATIGLMALSGPLLASLFGYGAFGVHDVRMTALSVITYSAGLLAFMMIKVLAPGFYARQDVRTPVRIGVLAMLSNMVLNVIFVLLMLHLKLPGPHAGLALANALSAYLNAALLFYNLRKNGIYQPQSGWRTLFPKLLLANGVMGLMLVLWSGDITTWMSWHAATRAWHLAGWVSAAIVVYFGALHLLGLRLAQLRGFGRGEEQMQGTRYKGQV
ncbi:MAG: murein biosynthesis integral membrane protein MurJ [Gammaproteobacteria bacterium]